MKIKVIDAHVHFLSKDNSIGPEFTFDFNHILERLERGIVEKMVVMPTVQPEMNAVEMNRAFLSNLQQFSLREHLWPLVWFHPDNIDVEMVSRPEVCGVKFHPSISQRRIDEAIPVLDAASKNEKPLLIHCGRGELSRIKYVLRINEQYPEIDFVCAHMGGLANDLVLAALKLLEEKMEKDNIFLDTSGCLNPLLLKKGVETVGADHIMFGTDAPFFDIDVSMYAIKVCRFPPNTIRQIYFETAASVYQNVSK
jgi:Tat protein secretion system quality control protein TatD with DNase activity